MTAQELTTAATEYSAIANTEPVQWAQPSYTAKLLHRIRTANQEVLSNLYTNRAHPELQNSIPEGSSLFQLAMSAKEVDHALPVLQALWSELTDPTAAARPPILFALDHSLNHIMKLSDYRNTKYELIHSHDLALVKFFTDALAGSLTMPHGGAILAATSKGNAPIAPSMHLALRQRLVEQRLAALAKEGRPADDAVDVDMPQRDPFFRGYDDRVEAVLRSVQVLPLAGLTRAEARALMEYWAASGVYRATVNERCVTDTWALGGHGVVGEMERVGLLTLRP